MSSKGIYLLDIGYHLCYDDSMSKQEIQLTQIGIRLGPAQMRQLVLLTIHFGGQTRAVTTAIDRLFVAELATNPAFAELVADNGDAATPPADATPPDGD